MSFFCWWVSNSKFKLSSHFLSPVLLAMLCPFHIPSKTWFISYEIISVWGLEVQNIRVIEYNESCVGNFFLQAPWNVHNIKEEMSSCIQCISVNWGIENWYALMSNEDLYLSWLWTVRTAWLNELVSAI